MQILSIIIEESAFGRLVNLWSFLFGSQNLSFTLCHRFCCNNFRPIHVRIFPSIHGHSTSKERSKERYHNHFANCHLLTWVTKSLWFSYKPQDSLNLRNVFIKTSSCHRLTGPVINLNTLFNQQSFTDRSLLTEIDCPRTDCAVLSHLELPRSMIYGFKTSYVCKVVSY